MSGRRLEPQPGSSNVFQEQQAQQPQANLPHPPLDPFYDQLLRLSFPDSVSAIEQCRELCAQYGFTVKQEASTHRNIYVYCSREGLPDSQRNPKSNPKRKRPSKRCDCHWRVVLYESGGHWEFRKSLNPEAAFHNHELMRPEEIERNWPKEVIDMIFELARQHLPTPEIRARIQAEFPDISWNERRFYNRLSEERQKIKQREAASRAHRLTTEWARVCMAAAGSEDLSSFVEGEVAKLLAATCQMAKLDPATLTAPVITDDPEYDSEPPTQPSQVNVHLPSSSQDHPETTTTTTTTTTTATATATATASGSGGNQPTQTTPSSSQQPQQPQPPSKRRSKVKPPFPKPVSTAPKRPDVPKGFALVSVPRHSYTVKIHSQRFANEIQRAPRRSHSTTTEDDFMMPVRKTSRKGKSKQQSTMEDEPLLPNSMMVEAPTHSATSPQQHEQHHQHHQQSAAAAAAAAAAMPSPSPFMYPHYDVSYAQSFGRYHQHHPYSQAPEFGAMHFEAVPAAPAASAGNEPTIHPALQSNPMAHAKAPIPPEYQLQQSHQHQHQHQHHQHQHHHPQLGMAPPPPHPPLAAIASVPSRNSTDPILMSKPDHDDGQHHGHATSQSSTQPSQQQPQQQDLFMPPPPPSPSHHPPPPHPHSSHRVLYPDTPDTPMPHNQQEHPQQREQQQHE